jgi:hypothetical protein
MDAAGSPRTPKVVLPIMSSFRRFRNSVKALFPKVYLPSLSFR